MCEKFGDFCIQSASSFFLNILIAWKKKSGIKMWRLENIIYRLYDSLISCREQGQNSGGK